MRRKSRTNNNSKLMMMMQNTNNNRNLILVASEHLLNQLQLRRCPFTSHLATMSRSFVSSSTTTTTTTNESTTTTATSTTPVLLADIGEGIKEVELIRWSVSVGDSVSQFDPLCEVQSDKATVEITSRYDGTVRDLAGHGVGDMIQVGSPLLFLTTATAAPTSTSTTTALPPPLDATASAGHGSGGGERTEPTLAMEMGISATSVHQTGSHVKAADDDEDDDLVDQHGTTSASTFLLTSPAVRKLAREHNLDLNTVHGTGPSGRILKSDVLAHLEERKLDHHHTTTPTTTSGTTGPASAAPRSSLSAANYDDDDEIVQLRGYSRLMFQTMTAALQTPHMCFGDEIRVDKLLECRSAMVNDSSSATATTSGSDGPQKIRVGVLALLIKMISVSLLQHPAVNCTVHSVDRCEVKIRRDHNIGVAMDTPRGLVVPVIHRCQTKSVVQIQNELDRLRACSGKFAEADLLDATFTVSNIGSVGAGTYMHPVLAPPAVAMGALGRIKTLPRYEKEDEDDSSSGGMKIVPAKIMTVTWAADHRFLDGASLGRFHGTFQKAVEEPYSILANLK
jgi:2-oxoisovalerate dehydrogenase E2 component (dihydrolipoyl transacylase)